MRGQETPRGARLGEIGPVADQDVMVVVFVDPRVGLPCRFRRGGLRQGRHACRRRLPVALHAADQDAIESLASVGEPFAEHFPLLLAELG
jgi:hypothetical protein